MSLTFMGVTAVATAASAGAQQGERIPVDSLRAADNAENERRVVRGRVLRPEGRAERGVPGTWVVLHRVGPDRAAPLDSAQSGVDGAYGFEYRTSGSPDAIYFVSAQYAGIAYFSAPLREAAVTGDAAEILVFDTSSVQRPLGVQGRHVVVSKPGPTGRREVVEIFELSNDTSVTLVSPSAAQPVWSIALPKGARDFQVGQGDVGGDAVEVRDGRVLVRAPFAPGVKQLSYSYKLDPSDFPLSIPTLVPTSVLEVLLEEPNGSASGPKLVEQEPASVSGRSFRRFLAQDVAGNAVMRLSVPTNNAARTRFALAVIATTVGAAMLLALVRAMTRRPRAVGALAEPLESERILAAITALDDAWERTPGDEEARAAYDAQREVLKSRLATALAEERRRT